MPGKGLSAQVSVDGSWSAAVCLQPLLGDRRARGSVVRISPGSYHRPLAALRELVAGRE